MFISSGLILVDSHHPELRKLEVPFFKQIIGNYKRSARGLHNQQEVIKALGYKPIIETKNNAVHIFMEIDNERVLLEENKGNFVGKDGAYSFRMKN